MEPARRSLLQAAACLAGLGSWPALAQQAAGRRYALLVGVSALQHQPRSLWLQGPSHDVQQMQQVLQLHGFAQPDMQWLADDGRGAALRSAQLPTRQHILQALHAMTRKLRAGDVVVLYWSGHAVRAQGPAKAAAETDGKSTFLLASDVQRVSAATHAGWPLRGAVADAEVGAAIDDWLARGAHVLVVMDTCYAASTTRETPSDTVRWRGLKVSELDVLHPQPAASAQTDHGLPGVLPAPRPRSHGYVGLYACEHMQRTPEWAIAGKHQGAFTHALTQALRKAAPGHSYAALCMRALDLHAALLPSSQVVSAQWPSPVFEGSLQAPLWTVQALPAWADRALSSSQSAPQPPQGVQLLLQIERPGAEQPQRMDLLQHKAGHLDLGQLPVGTRFALQVSNTVAQPWYLRIFYQGPQGRLQAIYPAHSGDVPEIPGADAAGPAFWQQYLVIDQPEQQPEALLWMLAPATAAQRIADAASAHAPAQAWRQQLVWRSVAATKRR